MKKALFLALAGSLLAALPALAYAPANVNFSSERGVPFSLVLDGRPLTRGVARQVHVDQLVPGQHWADFTIPAGRGAVHFRSLVWLEPGLETDFVLVARPGRPPVLRQAGAVALVVPGCPAPGYYGPGHQHDRHNGRYDDRDDYDYRNPGYGAPGGYNGPAGYPNGPGSGSNPGYGPGSSPGGPGAGYYPGSAVSSYRQLAPADVDALVQAVQQRPFEASRLSIAKEALRESSLQAADLKRLLRSFDFETSRVELAKYAYAHVADRQNFYRVYEAFDFESSVQEVQQAVAQ